MATDKQKAAARANGAKSRGPVTPEGKLRSSRSNSDRALLARTVVLDDESRERFDALLDSLVDELQPETAIERLLIHKMAAAHWRQLRLWGLEKAAYDSGDPRGSMNDYEMRFDRQFSRALDSFEKIRARSRQTTGSKPSEAVL